MTIGQEYLIFVTLVCIGAIQLASVFGSLKMLLFFESYTISKILGWTTIIIAAIWFFRSGGRNLPDTAGGLSGGSQFGLFALGTFLAITVIFLVTSVKNINHDQGAKYTCQGLSGLSHRTFLQILCTNLRILWKSYIG